MPICPNCGAYVSEGSSTCSCGTSMGRPSSYEEEDPEITERKEEAAGYFHRGVELERKGRYAEALSSYEKSRELGDRNFTSFKRGDLYYEMGDYEAALECYKKYGKDESALCAAAKALAKLGRYDEAFNNYFEVLGMIEASPRYVQDYTNPNCGIYYTKEELDREASKKQKRKRKDLARVYKDIAMAYMLQENYNVAIKYVDEAIDFDKANANYPNAKAIILERMGSYDEAMKCYDRAIAMESDSVFIDNEARMIKRWCSELFENMDDLRKAEALIDKAVDMLSGTESEEDISKYIRLRDHIQDLISYGGQRELLNAIGRENLIVITGSYYCGDPDFEIGMIFVLLKEPFNEFDSDAIAVYLGCDKVGYVANSPDTMCEMCSGASDLPIPLSTHAEYLMHYRGQYHIAKIRRDLDGRF